MIRVKFVTSGGCEHCEEIKEILGNLKQQYSIEVNEIDMESAEGLKLVINYSIMLAPAVIINNELISMGATSEEKLRKKLDSLKKD
jgi:glutaredoxin